jgi:hypothetical protein
LGTTGNKGRLTNEEKKQLDLKLSKLMEDKSINGWLSEFNKETTKEKYLQRIARFLEVMNTTPEALKNMETQDIKKMVLEYQTICKKKGLKNNGILSNITAVRSFTGFLNKPLKFRRSQLFQSQADTGAHVFSNGDLKRMFDVGDTFEKALIATAVSEGWEISSFLEQERNLVQRKLDHAIQNNEHFIFFEETREKTGVLRFCVLNSLAIEWLTKYLQLRKDDDPRLFPITQDGVQKMLYRLAGNSGLKTTGNLRFHKIRAWLMSRLSRSGFNEFQIKFVIGHSIPLQDRTYLNTLEEEITEKYPRVYNDYLNIAPVLNASKEELEILLKLKTEFDGTKSQLADIIAKQQKDKEKLEEQISSMYEFVHKNLDPAMDMLEAISKTPEGLELLKKLHAEKQAKIEEEYEKSNSRD